ncbi:trichohyalin [Denticeps clupeoides]|uniref:trichohyalin n=1 Tax=Denticeps clupeoides TaxID=299321 RepID=UPI0010A3E2B2|nr:trichohyalin-like [Denticeps clupeoides]
MAQINCIKASEDEDTDELLCTVHADKEAHFCASLPRDQCDLLLDAIDAHLSRMQTHRHDQGKIWSYKREEFIKSAPLTKSQCLSKDTGLGGNSPHNDKDASCLSMSSKTQEVCSTSREGDLRGQVEKGLVSPGKDEAESRTEQCLWRLERLLGRAEGGVAAQQPVTDSICTEEFSKRFKEDMVDVAENSQPRSSRCRLDILAVDTPSIRSETDSVAKDSRHLPPRTAVRHLAGVPVQSFDAVTVDSELESVQTERIRLHLHDALNNRMGSHSDWKNCRDRASCGSQHTKKHRYSKKAYSSADETENSEDCHISKNPNARPRRSNSTLQRRPRTSRDRRLLEETLLALRKDCEKEEKTLKQKQAEMCETERSLTALLQQKQHVVQQLDLIRTEVEQLQLCMRGNVVQAEGSRHELQRLQSQRNSCTLEVGALQEELVVLQQCRKLLQDRADAEKILNNAHLEVQQSKDEVKNLQERFRETIRQKAEQEEFLQSELKKKEDKLGALERIVAQKEVIMLALQEEKNSLHLMVASQKDEHQTELSEVQEQALREKEEELEQLRSASALSHEKELKQVKDQAEEMRSAALREHVLLIDCLQKSIQMKDAELQRVLEQQNEVMGRREVDLRTEMQGMVLQQELERWEMQKEAELQEQREKMREELLKQQKQSLVTLQDKVAELQKVHQREVVNLNQKLQHVQEEHRALQDLLADRERVHQGATESQEQQHRHWAQELEAEFHALQVMLGNADHTTISTHLLRIGSTSTIDQAVQALKVIRQQLQQFIISLQQELDSQKRTFQQLTRDREVQLQLQEEQMLAEKQRALDALQERLVQEHIEELSSFSRARMNRLVDAEEGVVPSLRRQLQAKDEELRQVQRSMGQWKERTTERLARKLEEELMSQLEKHKADLLRRRSERVESANEKKPQRLESEMRRLTTKAIESGGLRSASSPALLVSDPPETPRIQELASYKVLRHLQSRIRQLHTDTQIHRHSPSHQRPGSGELSGSYLELIVPVQERQCPGSHSGGRKNLSNGGTKAETQYNINYSRGTAGSHCT